MHRAAAGRLSADGCRSNAAEHPGLRAPAHNARRIRYLYQS